MTSSRPNLSLVESGSQRTTVLVEAPARPLTGAELRQHPAAVYLAGLAPSSRVSAAGILDRAARYLSGGQCPDALHFPWQALRYQDLAAFRSSMAASYSHQTANNYLSAVRRVLLECYRLGLMSREDYDRASDVPNVAGQSLPSGRHVRPEEIDRLFAYLDTLDTPTGARDRAAFAILRGTGIRRAELLALQLFDYDQTERSLEIRRGKGNKARVVYLPEWAVAYVEEWLRHRGHRPGFLLCWTNRFGLVRANQGLNAGAFWRHALRRCEEAGLEPVTLHDFRRTFCGDLLEQGHDIVRVQKAMGHSNPATTARYDRRPEEARREMAASIPAPGRGGRF
jgi:integrase